MKISKIIVNIFILSLFFSLFIPNSIKKSDRKKNNFYFKNSIHWGYDTNVLKYSNNEDNGLSSSSYLAVKSGFYSYLRIFKYKTKVSFNTRFHEFLSIKEKSNYGYSFDLDQPIGNYQHIKFKFLFINDIYLRVYDDLDNLVNDEIYYGDDCYFDLTKFQITYVSPYISSRDKVDFNIFYESNYYIPLFTEYDVDIFGGNLKLYSSNETIKYSFMFGYKNANNLINNLNILTEDYVDLSLRLADRSYKEYSFKMSYQHKVNSNTTGINFNYKKRSFAICAF